MSKAKANKHRQSAAPDSAEMPMMSRAVPVGSVDAEKRTAELTWTTGAQVRRYDWRRDRFYMEELSLDPAHVRMGRLESGSAPVLDTHSGWGISSVLGVVERASLDGADGSASVRFSKRSAVQEIFDDVADGIVRNVSVGYNIYRTEMIPPKSEEDTWIYRHVDWEPYELSLVPMGADADAGVRSQKHDAQAGRTVRCEFITLPAAAGSTQEERNMTDEERKAAEAAAKEEQAKAEQEAKRKAEEAAQREQTAKSIREEEAKRQADIRELATGAGMNAEFTDKLCRNVDMSVQAAGIEILREQSRRDAANPTRTAGAVESVRDEYETRQMQMGAALRLRANPQAVLSSDATEQREQTEAAREFRGCTLVDLARDCIEQAGGRTRGMTRREIATAALNLDRGLQVRAGMQSTSDFPEILANTVGRTLRQAYELSPRTFTPWARMSTAPDFKEMARTQLSDMQQFQPVAAGGEYKYLTFGESAEKYSLSKYGGIVALTWETIVNDDLGAFDRIPRAIAEEAGATEADIVYNILLNNGNMADGTPLFHGDHGNLPSAAAISEASLAAARALMRKQTGPKGRKLNLAPEYLVVGPDKELEANKFTSASFVAAKASDINPNFNTSLEVITEARITGNKWFLSAAPGRIDTVEYAYLEGEEGVFTETKQGFEVDGVMVKARHVFAAKAIDWRGLVYNPGA